MFLNPTLRYSGQHVEDDLLGYIARKSVSSMRHEDVICTNHSTDNFQPQALCND